MEAGSILQLLVFADLLKCLGTVEVQHFSDPGVLSLVCKPEVNDSSLCNTC